MTDEFFIDDKFYYDIEALIEDVLEWEDIEAIADLREDYSITVNEAVLEPMFKFDLHHVLNTLDEERYPEDNERIENQLTNLLKENIDFDKIKQGMPELYYQSRRQFTITKKDLL